MEATGSRDGREIVVALEALRAAGRLEHRADGRYAWREGNDPSREGSGT